jgi:hypothetical protein
MRKDLKSFLASDLIGDLFGEIFRSLHGACCVDASDH